LQHATGSHHSTQQVSTPQQPAARRRGALTAAGDLVLFLHLLAPPTARAALLQRRTPRPRPRDGAAHHGSSNRADQHHAQRHEYFPREAGALLAVLRSLEQQRGWCDGGVCANSNLSHPSQGSIGPQVVRHSTQRTGSCGIVAASLVSDRGSWNNADSNCPCGDVARVHRPNRAYH
jgi:hypothetical protein